MKDISIIPNNEWNKCLYKRIIITTMNNKRVKVPLMYLYLYDLKPLSNIKSIVRMKYERY